MDNAGKCFFCETECEVYPAPSRHQVKQYECKYCGVYLLGEWPGIYDIDIKEPSIKFKIACVLNERRLKGLGRVALVGKKDANVRMNEYSVIPIGDILNKFPQRASDFLERILLNLNRLAKMPFDVVKVDIFDLSADRLHFFASNKGDCETIIRELSEQGLIRCDIFDIDKRGIVLTAKSWGMIENLKKRATKSKRVFVAMWFDSSMSDFYEKGIKPAIEKAGYVSVRIDLQEFNNKICDEIISEIKSCKFLVSDFSGQRSGVYFEAGYAMGEGKAVIFTVKEDDVKNLHFDTRQYNHIVYNSPEDLCKKLYNRISATIV